MPMTEFEKYDKDKNGSLSKKEFQALELEDRRLKIQDADEKRNTERLLVKACCAGMLLYPFIILLASVLGYKTAFTNEIDTIEQLNYMRYKLEKKNGKINKRF